MGILDDILLGRRGEQRQLQSRMMDDYLNQKIIGIDERGILVEQQDRRASTLGAATALQRTTGSLPNGFFNRLTDNAPNTRNSSLLAFPDSQKQEIFQRLTDAGLKAGSSIDDIRKVFSQEGNEELRALFQKMMGSRTNPTGGGTRQPFGSTADSSNGRANSAGFASLTSSFLKGYRPNNAESSQKNNDVGALGTYLSSISRETGPNGEADLFGAWHGR